MSRLATLDERIAKQAETLEQLKRQKRAQEAREKKKQQMIDRRRNNIIGGIVSKHFPVVMKYEPKHNNTDNNIEFAPLDKFCGRLAERLRNDKALEAWLNSDSEILWKN